MATIAEMRSVVYNETGIDLKHISTEGFHNWILTYSKNLYSKDRNVINEVLSHISINNHTLLSGSRISMVLNALYRSIGYIKRCKELEWSEKLEAMYRSVIATLDKEDNPGCIDSVAIQMVQDAYGEMPQDASEPSGSPCKPFERIDKYLYYCNIAKAVAARSTCIRRRYGAVIVKNDEIIATGYNGSARGEENCCDKGVCWREEHKIPHGEQYEKCVAVHAEQNALISASRSEMIGADMYLYGCEWDEKESKWVEIDAEPCLICDRMIRNSGISCVYSTRTCKSYAKFRQKTAFLRNEFEADSACQDGFEQEK